jgi:hypothetical protein
MKFYFVMKINLFSNLLSKIYQMFMMGQSWMTGVQFLARGKLLFLPPHPEQL